MKFPEFLSTEINRWKVIAGAAVLVALVTVSVPIVRHFEAVALEKLRQRAQAQFGLFASGASFGSKHLLIQSLREQKMEADSAMLEQYQSLGYLRDSLVWEIRRIGNDTLSMPERKPVVVDHKTQDTTQKADSGQSVESKKVKP